MAILVKDSELAALWDRLAPFAAQQFAPSNAGSLVGTPIPSAGLYQTIQEEGVALPQWSTFNIVGAALTAADDGANSRTNITLSQSPGGSTSVVGTGRLLTAGPLISAIGDLSADRTISLANGTANYQVPTTLGGSPFTPQYKLLSDFAGAGLTFSSGTFVVGQNLLSATHSDTAAASPTRGDLIVANSSALWSRFALGVANRVLFSNGTDPSWSTLDLSTALFTSILPVGKGGSGTSTAFTAGSIVFAGASGVYTQDNANLFFDDTNNRLGVGTATPGSTLDLGKAIAITVSNTTEKQLNVGGSVTSTSRVITAGAFDFNTAINPDTGGSNVWGKFSGVFEPKANLSGTNILIDETMALGSATSNSFNLTGTLVYHRIRANLGGSGYSGTVANVHVVQFATPVLTGSTAITNLAGWSIAAFDGFATNTTNVLIGTTNIPSGTWSIYNQAPYDNYFGGSIGIGATNFNSAGKTLALSLGSAPAGTTTDTVFVYEADRGGAAGKGGIAFYTEDTTPYMFADRIGLFTLSPTIDMGMTSLAARIWGLERHSTSNTAGNNLTVQAGGATSGATDKAGGTLNLDPGIPTGLGRSVVSIGGYSLATATGTGDNTRIPRQIVGPGKVLANNTVTALVNCSIASNTVIAVVLRYAVEVFNGTDLQIEEGFVTLHATNKAGVIANNTIVKSGNQQAMTSGTLTVTFTITAANPAVVSVNANSSLTPSTGYPRITYSIDNLTQQIITIQ